MARIYVATVKPTAGSVSPLSWMIGLVLLLASLGLILITMAQTRGRTGGRGRSGSGRRSSGPVVPTRARRKNVTPQASSSSSTAEYVEEETDEEESGDDDEEDRARLSQRGGSSQAGAGVDEDEVLPGVKLTRKRNRPQSEIDKDEQAKWVRVMARKRSFNNERQVDIESLGPNFPGVSIIRQRGMGFWFKKLSGYNANAVIEFYTNMVPDLKAKGKGQSSISSKVGNKTVKVTEDRIAEYLGYTRPQDDPGLPPFPEGKTIIDEVYVNPVDFERNQKHKPGKFKEQYRLLNKAINANLIPCTSGHELSSRTLELMVLFASVDIPLDCARSIFEEMVDFRDRSHATTKIPFPCMITAFCRNDGVRGSDYNNLETLKPGRIDSRQMKKSGAHSRPTPLEPEPVVHADVPSSSWQTEPSASPPREPPRRKSSKVMKMLKAIFCQIADVKQGQVRIERRQERMAHEINWLSSRVPNVGDDVYVPPPEQLEEEPEPVMPDFSDSDEE